MPELSRFLGIVISMYFDDHNPPHFHVWYNDFRALISIRDLSLFQGELPPRVLGLVMEWAGLHKNELLEDWNMVQETGKWFKIEPLV
jgi:predicted membrane metal-binding protein